MVRYCFDADLLGLTPVSHGVATRHDLPGEPGAVVHKQEHAAYVITDRSTLDEVWIPQVAAQGWVILTRDGAALQDQPAEIERRARLRRPDGGPGRRRTGTGWAQLELFMTQVAPHPGLRRRTRAVHLQPTRTTFRAVPL